MYHFEERVARHDEYYILRDISHSTMDTIIEGRVAHRDRYMEKYVPRGSQTER